MWDANNEISNLIKDEQVSKHLSIFTKYLIKSVYDVFFIQRSKNFCCSIIDFYDKYYEKLKLSLNAIDLTNINIVNQSITKLNVLVDEDIDNTIVKKENFKNNNVTEIDMNTSVIEDKEISFAINSMLLFNAEYILDSNEDILIILIKKYIFSKEDPTNSLLLLCYSFFCSSIELAFSLRLILNFPVLTIYPKEQQIYVENNKEIVNRLKKFIMAWKRIYTEKFKNNSLLNILLNSNQLFNTSVDYSNQVYSIKLTDINREEPKLTKNFVLFSKINRESIFIFDIDEIARQICLIDHMLLSNLNFTEYIKRIKKDDYPMFNNIIEREKSLKAFILFSIFIEDSIDSKINLIDKYVKLAKELINKNNYQTYTTIIKAFSMINIKNKKAIWNKLDADCKYNYLNMLNDIEKLEMNESFFSIYNTTIYNTENSNLFVPNFVTISTTLDMIKKKIKSSNINENVLGCEEFRDFYLVSNEIINNTYPWFRNNPLYDYLLVGYKELFRTDVWRPDLKKYSELRSFLDDEKRIDKVLQILDAQFKKYED